MNQPIRVLHIVQRLEAGGTQALLMNIYRNIDRNKIQFDFLVEYPNKYFYDDEVLSLGGRVFYSTVRVDYNLIKFKRMFSMLLKNENYKIIHMHMSNVGYICFKEAKKQGVPIRIAHNHNNGSDFGIKTFPRYILGKLYTVYATNFFACSKEAGEFRFKNKPYYVMKNGINSAKFIYNQDTRNIIRNKLKLNDKLVVGHIGRFHKQKNHMFLLDIFYKLHQKEKKSILLLIGDGDLKEKIQKKIEQLNLKEHVILLGNIKNVNEILQAIDILLLPSLFEGLGIVAIEAQAASTPVLCSDTVSKDVEISPICYKYSLNKSSNDWANKVLEISRNNISRKNMQSYIKAAGFDIYDVTLTLQNFYLSEYDNYIKNNKSNDV